MTPYEIFQDVKGFEGYYMVSNIGRVKSLARITKTRLIGEYVRKEKFLRPVIKEGYKSVALHKDGLTRNFSIHRLIAIHFIPNPNNHPCINHKNSDRQDNSIENLEWCTYSHNNKHAYSHGHNYSCRAQLGKKNELSGASKPVMQFDMNWTFIKEWTCAAQADRETGISFSLISQNCKRKCKSAKGFRWKLKEDLTPYEIWQIEKHNSILHGTKEEEFENGKERQDREAEWTLANEERQLTEYEY